MQASFGYPNAVYTHTCSMWIRSLWRKCHRNTTWFQCRPYKLVKRYTCRRPLIIPVRSKPIPALWSGPLEGQQHMDGLGQYCSNSIANALGLLQSCTKPSIWSKPDINAFHIDYLNSMYTHTCSLWIRSLDGQYYIKSTRYHIINDTILFSGNNRFIIWRKYKYPKIRWLIDLTPPFSFSSHDSHLFHGNLMHLISAPDFIFVIITSMYITQLHFCWSKTSTLGSAPWQNWE